MSALDDKTRSTLKAYARDVRTLPNESAKTHRFIALVAELFPGTSVVSKFAAGIEKIVRIDTAAGTRRRFLDAYHGNAIIEFENSLEATEQIALTQLREQAAGVWSDEGPPFRPLVCVASDGATWKVYRPRLVGAKRKKPRPENVELHELRTIRLSDETLEEFWFWLTNLLFRVGPEITWQRRGETLTK